jgi:hypothetical protein
MEGEKTEFVSQDNLHKKGKIYFRLLELEIKISAKDK